MIYDWVGEGKNSESLSGSATTSQVASRCPPWIEETCCYWGLFRSSHYWKRLFSLVNIEQESNKCLRILNRTQTSSIWMVLHTLGTRERGCASWRVWRQWSVTARMDPCKFPGLFPHFSSLLEEYLYWAVICAFVILLSLKGCWNRMEWALKKKPNERCLTGVSQEVDRWDPGRVGLPKEKEKSYLGWGVAAIISGTLGGNL